MDLSTVEYLKKALMDTQEKVRDFESYAKTIQDNKLSNQFHEWAEEEGHQASELEKLISEYSNQ